VPAPQSHLAATPLRDVLASLAAKTPTPGGGASACIAGALAAAQAEMVVAYSLGKKNLTEHQPRLAAAQAALARARAVLLELAEEDAAAYAEMNELGRLLETDPRRMEGYAGAVQRCVQVPTAALAACSNMLRLLDELTGITNRHLRSDLAIAAVLAEAAARACDWNVRINLAAAGAVDWAPRVVAETKQELADAAERAARVQRACAV
jgi:methenyltetrahydrofolate cyclohydrolase